MQTVFSHKFLRPGVVLQFESNYFVFSSFLGEFLEFLVDVHFRSTTAGFKQTHQVSLPFLSLKH